MNQSSKNILLKIKNYTIHFPSGYEFTMNLPSEITIHQITQIMRSYSALHNAYGLKHEGRVLQPRYLESLDQNILCDAYLVDDGDEERELGALGNASFKIVYGLRDKAEENKHGFCAFRRYQFLGKLSSNTQAKLSEYQTYTARDRATCHLYSLISIPKKLLNFPKIELLLSKLTQNNSCSFSSSSLITPGSIPIHQVFETENNVCIVREYFPFQLDYLLIDSKYLMDVVLSQVGRILHVKSRMNGELREVQLSQFRMGFDLRVVYCQFDLQTEQSEGQNEENIEKNNQFGTNMCRIFERLLKNCSLRVIQLYIPLLHWLKNKRIITYIDFLKYSQINPTMLQDPQNSQKRKLILSNLINNYISPKIIGLSQRQIKEFSITYLPKTDLFRVRPSQNEIYSPNKKIYNQQNPELSELLQNISTIKKKKQQIQVSPKPVYEIFLKRNKIKSKLKNKTKTKSLIQQNHTDNPRKTSKNKKHERKISQFLIDDD